IWMKPPAFLCRTIQGLPLDRFCPLMGDGESVKGKFLHFNLNMTRAIGIDLGGNNIKGVLLDASGDILYQDIQPTETNDSQNSPTGQQWKKTVARMVLELKKNSLYPINAIGLAAPGLSNSDNSAIRLMPGRLNGLENFIWSDYLGENEVWTMNDAHAALIAESKFGVGKGLPNLVMLTLGTGVGGGILINGELYQVNNQMEGHL